MTTYTIDFETRSAQPIKHGAWRYAEDPSTDVICLAIKEDDEPAGIWVPGWVLQLFDGDVPTDFPVYTGHDLARWLTDTDALLEAHNAEFERAIWECVMHGKYGLPSLYRRRWSCTAARAARLALPRGLDKLAEVIGAKEQKDSDGHKLMMKMSKPRKPRKAEKEADPAWADKLWWYEEPEQIIRLCQYCIQDVETERAVSKMLPELPKGEREIWELDQEINRRGIYVDRDAIGKVLALRSEYRAEGVARIREITGDPTMTENRTEALLEWLSSGQETDLPDMTKDEVEIALDEMTNMPAPAREVLELRHSLAKTSIRKFTAMLRSVCADGRMRSLFMYHGCSTGRWSGKGVQVHNLPRGKDVPDYQTAIDALDTLDPETIAALWCDPMDFFSALIRPVLTAEEGMVLLVADYSAIEGRVLPWLAGEEKTLQQYRNGLDLYKVAAGTIYSVGYDSVDDSQRSTGKVSELALGFQGGIGAYVSMGRNYGLRTSDYEALYPNMVEVSTMDEIVKAQDLAAQYLAQNPGSRLTMRAAIACDLIKRKWRFGRPKTVQFWQDLDDAAIAAVRNPGRSFWAGRIRFEYRGSFLRMWLPSGRALHYFQPHLRSVETPWGEMRAAIHYWGVDSTTKKWTRLHSYGGKWAENATQAVARDVLKDAMLRCDHRWPVVLHVHDEIASEVDSDRADELDDFCTEMARNPDWAPDLPIAVDGWAGVRYHK